MDRTETEVILKVNTEDGVVNIKSLKESISALKGQLNETEIGSTKYQETLKELNVYQNALKDAMHGTTVSLEDLSKGANGANQSYNGLVHRMAQLKEHLRTINTATPEGVEEFKKYAGQINEVNNKLKEMDEWQGSFQRNVGNYPGTIKTWAGSIDALDKALKVTTGGLGGVKGGFDALATSPGIAIFGIVMSVAGKLIQVLKDNETMMGGLKKALNALKPVTDFFAGILETVATWLGDIIGKAASFLGNSGIFQKVVKGVMGIGNAVVDYVIAPFKAVIAAIKVFKEEGIKGFKDAASAFGNEIKNGFSFKKNFETGATMGETFIKGMTSKKKEAKEAGKEIGKEVAEGMDAELKKAFEKTLKSLDKSLAKKDKEFEAWAKHKEWQVQQWEEDMEDQLADIDMSEADDILEEQNAAFMEKQERLRRENMSGWEKYNEDYAGFVEKHGQTVAKWVGMYTTAAAGISNLLGSIAEAYESDTKASQKELKKAKNLRIAGATIDMLSGVVTAFASAMQLGPILGPIMGAVNSAAVLTTGAVNIAKLKSQSTSADSTSTSTTTPSVSAPIISSSVPTVRTLTSASEEDRLNRAASSSKVYILDSDLQAAEDRRKVLTTETSW